MKFTLPKFIRHFLRGDASGNATFTKDIFSDSNYEIGEYTYGKPEIMHWGEMATLKIGKFCSISDNVKIFLGGNHKIEWISTFPFSAFPEHFPEARDIKGHPATKGDVIIGNDVWLAHSVSILSGVKIGNGAVIGAGSLVTKNVGPYEIWAGNPAVFIKKRFSQDVIDALEKEAWWDLPKEKIMERVNLLCQPPQI